MKLLRLIYTVFIINIGFVLAMHAWGRVSSQAQFIAYTLVDTNYNPHVMLYDFTTGLSIELTTDTNDGRLYGRTPIWSQDGQYIAYRTYRNRGDVAVFEFDVERGTATNLTDLYATLALPIYTSSSGYALLANANVEILYPNGEADVLAQQVIGGAAFSPDGHYLAYLAREDRDGDEEISEDEQDPNDQSEFDIWLLDLQTRERISLTENIDMHGNPVWSPDSQKIVFRSVETPVNDIVVIDVQTGDLQTHDVNMYPTSPPSWSPDSQRIVFSMSQNQSALNVYTLDITSGDVTQQTTHTSYDIQPAWSSDGKWISFVSRRHGQDDIYALHLESGHIRRLTRTPDAEADPVWQPR